ncbi:MAG: CDP-alcohol phosphatidyltransferase family protein [Leptospiraceae bacterium]|nr:CDP-alcohol phosphatidyltransferase family protein [Leptospiraceae bacterium]
MKDIFLLPNIITCSRILLIIPSLYYLAEREIVIASILITTMFLTDFFDGFVARKWEMKSTLGAILDPVADKIVVISFFSFLFYQEKVYLLYFLLLLIRQVSQLISVPVLLWKKISFQVKPKFLPKLGTALNFILLGFLSIEFIYLNVRHLSFFENGAIFLMFCSGALELYILATFLPRFYQIYHGTHDTFE